MSAYRSWNSKVAGVKSSRLVLAGCVCIALSACGVASNKTAATIDGTDISMASLEALASDPSIQQIIKRSAPRQEIATTTTLPGSIDPSDLRAALNLKIKALTYANVLKDWGGEVTAEDTQGAQAEIEQSFGTKISPQARDLLGELSATQKSLTRLAPERLPKVSGDALAAQYEEQKASFQSVCFDSLAVPIEDADRARELLTSGDFATALQQNERWSSVGRQECSIAAEYGDFPFVSDLVSAPVGEVAESQATSQGADFAIFVRVKSRTQLAVDDPEVSQLLEQRSSQLRGVETQQLLRDAIFSAARKLNVTIDSRLGTFDPTSLGVEAPISPRTTTTTEPDALAGSSPAADAAP